MGLDIIVTEHMGTYAQLSTQIGEYLENPASNHCQQVIAGMGIRSLPVLIEFLHQDLPIARTECLETLVKLVLRDALTGRITGEEARSIARFQKELGFVLKYKSYAIKASVPLGYSIFLQKDGEGFSFQRHVEHKLEVFHIVTVKPGGYVFLCDFEDWKRAYMKDSFERWLGGESNPAFDRYKFVPEPGDVFVISTLGVVHTVVGCVLEEYATVSTDMVDRLHDQNAGKKIPADFTRAFTEAALREIEPPPRNRMVKGFGAREIETIEPVAVPGGEQFLLCDSFVRAARYVIKPGAETATERDDHRAVLLRISRGRGSAVMADASELGGPKPRLAFDKGDLFLIPPGIHYAIRNEGSGYVEYSEHRIAPGVAFI
jgi:mannose-6-phosphate isomerase-like protein (cupin superfamily)